MKNVTIYSTPTCHFCKEAKTFLAGKNVPFTEFNVASDIERRKEMIDKSGQMGVPVIDVGGQIIIGYDESELASALGI